MHCFAFHSQKWRHGGWLLCVVHMGSWHSMNALISPQVLTFPCFLHPAEMAVPGGRLLFVVHRQLGHHASAVYRLLALLQPCLPLMCVVSSPAEMALPGGRLLPVVDRQLGRAGCLPGVHLQRGLLLRPRGCGHHRAPQQAGACLELFLFQQCLWNPEIATTRFVSVSKWSRTCVADVISCHNKQVCARTCKSFALPVSCRRQAASQKQALRVGSIAFCVYQAESVPMKCIAHSDPNQS